MSRRTISTLHDGDSVDEIFLTTDKQLRTNRNGQSFIQLTMQDRTGSVTGRVWNAGEPLFKTFEVGEYIKVKGKVQLFQGTLQMIVNSLEKIDTVGVNMADFLPRTEQDITKLLEKLRSYLNKLGNPYLRTLAQCYLMDDSFLTAFCTAPAGVRVHHAYVGGLLEHVVTMMDVADKILPLYPDVNRDLLIIGVFLHDTGKIRELTYESAFNYSDEGQLLGHMNIGIEMLQEYRHRVKDLMGEEMPEDLLLRLKHMILSHHGTAEFGSPKIPMTPEAVALHAIDNLDSRITITVREIKDDVVNSANWTPYNNAMQRKLYKGPKAKNGFAEDDDEE